MVHIHTTEEILKDLNSCIENKDPFSIVRFGDAIYGILSSFLCPNVIPAGKWSRSVGRRRSNNILGQLTIPDDKREDMCNMMVDAANNANYIDSYDAYKMIRRRRLGIIARMWQDIHNCCGITNTSYCSCFVHYFSIVQSEYNLFDIMKGRKIFCITSRLQCLKKLEELSGAEVLDSYRIPRRGRKARHFRDHFEEVNRIINKNATKYDLFLIGGGFLGKLYGDNIKKNGGRAFDAGRLFDFWSNVRLIDSAPKRFLVYNKDTFLCRRKRRSVKGKLVW